MSNLLRRLVSSSSATALPRPSRNGSPSHPTRILRARAMHSRTRLPYPIEEGLGDFLSPEALQVVAGDYQSGLLTRLEDEIKGKLHVRSIISGGQVTEVSLKKSQAQSLRARILWISLLKPLPTEVKLSHLTMQAKQLTMPFS